MTTNPQIACEKCKQGTMVSTRVPRMSSGLRIVGFTLWIPALLVLVFSAGSCLLMTGATGNAAAAQLTRLRAESANRLRDLPDIPISVVETFETTGAIAPSALDALPAATKRRAEAELSTYAAGIVGTTIGDTAVAGAAGLAVLAVYVICVPLFIVGLLLTRKKNVWKCPTCGFVFDRA